MKERDFTAVLVLAVAFVGATMTANIMSMRMVAPLGVVIDAGTVLYPLTFIVRDQIHQRAGKRISDNVVKVSAIANLAMFACFYLTAWLPYDEMSGPQEEFAMVLLPGILLVFGSVIAQYIGERIDGVIYHRIYRGGEGSAHKAAFLSNLVSIPIDTCIVCTIGFAFTIPFDSYISTMTTNILLKYAITVAVLATSIGATNVIESRRVLSGRGQVDAPAAVRGGARSRAAS